MRVEPDCFAQLRRAFGPQPASQGQVPAWRYDDDVNLSQFVGDLQNRPISRQKEVTVLSLVCVEVQPVDATWRLGTSCESNSAQLGFKVDDCLIPEAIAAIQDRELAPRTYSTRASRSAIPRSGRVLSASTGGDPDMKPV